MAYIDREKFRMHIIRYNHNPLKVTLTDKEKEKFIRMLDEVPTADVVERKRGKWLDDETTYSDDIPQACTCSVCGRKSNRPLGDFCKWCGADMREDTDNQTTVCPMCPDCPDNCPLGADMREETEDEN